MADAWSATTISAITRLKSAPSGYRRRGETGYGQALRLPPYIRRMSIDLNFAWSKLAGAPRDRYT